MITLKDTANLMTSDNYNDRVIAEYWQTKIRYEKLKEFNTRIEASNTGRDFTPIITDSPDYLLERQQTDMGHYLHDLEVRAVIENIDISFEHITKIVDERKALRESVRESMNQKMGAYTEVK